MTSSTTLAALVAHCRKLARGPQTPDAELLRCFVERREASAFEELLERYAPLVWGVCRRISRNENDCEDAFQATFLSLVRQADTIDPNRPLGAWLHTIAVRASAKAKARVQRQRTQANVPERTTQGDLADELGNRELFQVVDEEIARLPLLLREPFVLCCLEGRTRDEAAAALSCSVAAIKSRLERSRHLMRRRLEHRGFGLPAAFLVLGLTSSQVRASLRTKALQSALGSASPAVSALVPVTFVSYGIKATLAAMSLVLAGVLGFGAVHMMQAEPPQDTPAPATSNAPKSPQAPLAEKSQPLLDRFGDPLPPGAVRRFGSLRFRHPEIVDLAFTPDGKQLIAGCGRNPLSMFDAATGRRLREVGKSSANNIYGFALSPDGKRVACCGFDVFVWELETGRLIRELKCGRCQSVAFSPDGKKIAAVKEMRTEIDLVEVGTGKHLGEWTIKEGKPLQFSFRSLAFSPDGKFLAGILSEMREEKEGTLMFHLVSSQVYLLDAGTGKQVRAFESAKDSILAFAFQPGTGRLAIVGKDGILRFWDAGTGKELHRLPARKGMGYVPRFSADGRRCLALDKDAGILAVLDARDGRELRRIKVDPGLQSAVIALSPDGRAVAMAAMPIYFVGGRVRVWDIDSGTERLADAGHNGPPTLSLSRDGRTLISKGEEVFHWNLRTGEGKLQSGEIEKEDPRFSWSNPNWTARSRNWQLKINYNKLEIEVRSLDGSRLLHKIKMPTANRGFALSPDGTHLAVSFQDRGHTVFLWDPEKEEKPRELLGHPDACQQLLFSHDGKRLIAGAGTHNNYSSETIWIWDVATARLVRKLATNSAPGYLLLTADDRVLITGGLWNDATVHAWDMETGKELARLVDPSLKHASTVETGPSPPAINGLALSVDERFLAIVSSWGESSAVSVWETSSWKLVRSFAPTQPRYYANSMIFSRDGRSLFVSNSDSTILQWDISGRFGHEDKIPNRDRLNVLWRTLAEAPDKAYSSAWELLDLATESVPYLIDKLTPNKPIDELRVRRLLGQLDAESFAEREEASRQLLALGEQTLPVLRKALKDKPALETKKRIEGVIESLSRGPTPEQLRLLRALAVLEWSDLPSAREHLKRLAEGDQAARITCAAKQARQRR
ncbi:MAG TPA: sigma-70 family RNA polymerase sigma factor [Gemmataceae bacterium]|nr:sigma-70 family RNA polymerase sigma factor [Gemmataceae bacterium]